MHNPGRSVSNTSMQLHNFPIPEGFQTLLTSLAREVLRAQPVDVYDFSALYFETLQSFRDRYEIPDLLNKPDNYKEFKADLIRKAYNRGLVGENSYIRPDSLNVGKNAANASHDDKIGASQLSASHGQSRKESPIEAISSPEDEAASKIQAGIRGYLTRKHVSEKKSFENKAATKIQSVFRGYRTRKHGGGSSESRTPASESALSPTEEPHLRDASYVNEGFSVDGSAAAARLSLSGSATVPTLVSPEEEDAAVKIQSAFRGFHQRQQFVKERDAAAKIQAGFRGYQVRRNRDGDGIGNGGKRHSVAAMGRGGGSGEEGSDEV
jgi:hypothetical protein